MSPSLRWFVVVAMILGSFGGLLVLSTTLNEESSDSTDTQPGTACPMAVIWVVLVVIGALVFL